MGRNNPNFWVVLPAIQTTDFLVKNLLVYSTTFEKVILTTFEKVILTTFEKVILTTLQMVILTGQCPSLCNHLTFWLK